MAFFERVDASVRYDIIVIGCGVAGYTTALRATQLGLRVVCIEQAPMPGGAGIHTGCIPSRILLHGSELYDAASKGKGVPFGVTSSATLDLAIMMEHKDKIVRGMAEGVKALLHKHEVSLVYGRARLAGPGRVVVRDPRGMDHILFGSNIVIATGSEPVPFPDKAFDHERVLDSADALRLDSVPRHLAIVGAGSAGVEIGCIWQRLGAQITLIERKDRICSWLDRDMSAALEVELRRQGMSILLSNEATELTVLSDGISIRLNGSENGGGRLLGADLVLVTIGRRPAVADLNLASVGFEADFGRTLGSKGLGPAMPGVWVIGDANSGGAMLVSKAEDEAIACAEQIAGLPGFVNYTSIPIVLDSTPEVAMIGLGEEALQAAGTDYKIGRFPLAANARAQICGVEDGFVKLLVDGRTQLIAGGQVIGPGAATLISEIAVAMDTSTMCEDFARTTRPHPTWSEALRQAAMAAGGWMMHE